MTISLYELCASAEQSSKHDLPLPAFTSYVYGPTNSPKYMYILKKGVPFNQIVQGQWVFTLSIASKDLERAWQIIAPRLFDVDKGLFSCEVYNLNYTASKDIFRYENDGVEDGITHPPQKKDRDGAQIIIHSTPNYQQPHDLFMLLADVEALLISSSVQAGSAKPRANLKVEGSSYFYARNQLNGVFRLSISKALRLAQLSNMPAHNITIAANPYAYFNLGERKHSMMDDQKNAKNDDTTNSIFSPLTTTEIIDDCSYGV